MKNKMAIYCCGNDDFHNRVEKKLCANIAKSFFKEYKIDEQNIYVDVKTKEKINYLRMLKEIEKGNINCVIIPNLKSFVEKDKNDFSLINKFPFEKAEVFICNEKSLISKDTLHFLKTNGQCIVDATINLSEEEIEKE